jgi:hypothetical protein
MAAAYDSELAKKLNIKTGMTVQVVTGPAEVDLSGLPTTAGPSADGVLVFVRTLSDIDRNLQPLFDATETGRIAWMAYPKARQLGTDLDRDILGKHMRQKGMDAVRQVAIDDTWSAMRFKIAD